MPCKRGRLNQKHTQWGKYIIAGAAFTIWMFFFDRNDVATQYGYYSQLKELKAEKEFYTLEIEKITKSLHDLDNDPQALQRVAREKYKMKKENEDVFVLIEEEGE